MTRRRVHFSFFLDPEPNGNGPRNERVMLFRGEEHAYAADLLKRYPAIVVRIYRRTRASFAGASRLSQHEGDWTLREGRLVPLSSNEARDLALLRAMGVA